MRLLSFLTAIEHALAADEPAPRGGVWENHRTINYHQQSARLSLATLCNGRRQALGEVFLQGYKLADGSRCLKALISWKDGGTEITHSIYEKPDLNWEGQARAIASQWLNGQSAEVMENVTRLSAVNA